MKAKIFAVGETVVSLDPEDAGPAVREAIEDGCNDVASTVIDWTDSERDSITLHQYAVVTDDDGTESWRGWLEMGRKSIPPPDAAIRDALEAKAREWDGHAVTLTASAEGADPGIVPMLEFQAACFRDHAFQLRGLLGGVPDGEDSRWPCCLHCIDGDGMRPCGQVHPDPCGTGDCGNVTDDELREWRAGLDAEDGSR